MLRSFFVVKLFLLFLCVSESLSNSDALELTDEEYYQMPDLFALDNYYKCMSQKDAVFCVGAFELLSPQPSQIYDVIKKFSENSFANFNHTRIHRGTCLGPRSYCPIFENTTHAQAFELCVDKNIRKEYGLQARMIELNYCKTKDQKRQFDSYDWAFLYYTLAIFGLNIAGTLYDAFLRDPTTDQGNRFLLCFSLKANWARFTGGSVSDPRYSKLKCFNGLRAILTFLVHIAHVPICMLIFSANPRFIEEMSSSPEFAAMTNGTVAIQAFLVMSVFLRCFKIYIDAEKHQPNFKTVLVAISDRFARIVPLFMTSVGFSATLVAYTNDGPLFKKYVEDETEVCRANFWTQFFLMQHWYPPGCLPQAWYLSVDFQLYVICTALTVYLIRRGKSVLKPMLVILAVSLMLLFCIVYTFELKPTLQSMTPEALYSLFRTDRSFILLYQSVWGNFPGALMGAMAAYVYYTARQQNIDLTKYKWFRFMFRMAFPTTVMYCVVGYLIVTKMSSRFTVSLYATLDKPIYAMVVTFFVIGCMYEINHVTRRVVEWRGWVLISRLSLASLLFHITLSKVMASTLLFPPTFTRMSFIFNCFSITVGTFMVSLPLCLLVEYPFIALYKTFTEPRLLKWERNANRKSDTNGYVSKLKET